MDIRAHDYHRLLGVSYEADFDALKRAYYRRAKQCHPDKFPGRPDKEEEFKQLVAAFDVLSDPVRRTQLDRMLEHLAAAKALRPNRCAGSWLRT